MSLALFRALTRGENTAAYNRPEVFVTYGRELAVTHADDGAVITVMYKARGIDRAPLIQRWPPATTHLFAEWARRQGYDAVCLLESAYRGELGYEWVAGTFGKP